MSDQSLVVETFQPAVTDCIRNNKSSEKQKLDDACLTGVENLGPFTRSILAAIMNNAYSNVCNKSLD
jgi:hypothetical protein